ncbi:MAG: hypothetical protein KDD42_07070, partial [Bdellovibrionales bacterium]|nr:hypothetical protein [Bdellovibrionales bacterium]
MFIGFSLAAVALSGGGKDTLLAAVGVPLLAIGVPAFDTLLALWRRSVRRYLSRGTNSKAGLMHADMDHLHHRLVQQGFTQRAVALWLYVGNAALVIVATLSQIYKDSAIGLFVVSIVAGGYVVARHLARVELWDSGSAILRGLTRPGSSVLASLLYPVFDFVALCLSLVFALLLDSTELSFSSLKERWFLVAPVWCSISYIALFLSGAYSRVWSFGVGPEFQSLHFCY